VIVAPLCGTGTGMEVCSDVIFSVAAGVAYTAELEGVDKTVLLIPFAVDGEELDAASLGHTPNHDWHFASQYSVELPQNPH
jgi:hypothetical protein